MLKRYVLFSFVLSLLYIVSEAVFNISLLNALSIKFDASRIELLETVGKVISGVGLWLLFLKALYLCRNKLGVILFSIFAVSILILSIIVMTKVQEEIAAYLAEQSSPTERKSAFAIGITMDEIIDGNVEVKGFDIAKEDFKTPEGKTYLAILPAVAVAQSSSEEVFSKAAINSIKLLSENKIREQGLTIWGKYKKLNNEVRDEYNFHYMKASDEFNKMQASINPEEKWNKYVDELDRNRINIHSDNERIRKKVISKLASEGLSLPLNWALNDKDTFIQSVLKQHEDLKSFKSFVKKYGNKNTNLPPNLNWTEFSNSNEVQNKIRNAFGFKGNERISLDLTQKEFFKKFVKTNSSQIINETLKKLNSNNSSFANGSIYEKDGKDAIKRLKVPVIALGFSCFFAVLNICLLSFNLIGGFKGIIVSSVLVAFAFLYPFSLSNKITSSPTFYSVVSNWSLSNQIIIKWIANVQPLLYENAIRFKVSDAEKLISKDN